MRRPKRIDPLDFQQVKGLVQASIEDSYRVKLHHSLTFGCPEDCNDPRCIDEYEEYASDSGVDDEEPEETAIELPENND